MNAPSSARAWLRALELTAPIPRDRGRILPHVLVEQAAARGDARALVSDRENLSYSELSGRVHQYARWARAEGLGKGDVLCLLMGNRPEYLAIWLGLTSVGIVVALLNTNLVGRSLAHSIQAVSPARIVVDADLAEKLATALPLLDRPIAVYLHGAVESPVLPECQLLDVSGYPPVRLAPEEPVTIDDLALLIYTSGTTGLPKAARVTHARLMQWSHWFAGMMEVVPEDRIYNCLPMYHSVGGVQAPGAMLVSGGSVVLRDKFSAGAFWSDIVRFRCTLVQYIGEMCRYLLHAPPSVAETEHLLRLACGNGLAPELWSAFQERFRLPRILEFYAATESNVSLFNVEGKPGAIGRVPPYLEHRFSPPLVRYDAEAGEPARDATGSCIRCGPDEIGEALGRISDDAESVGSRFDGYTNEEASAAKILRDVFRPGDCWFRTGDLMRRDRAGYFYFADRVGETFRRKGENVSTSEVAAALCSFAGVQHANVYGVPVPHTDGRAGMATIVPAGELDLAALRRHLFGALPPYARPAFLRIRAELPVTGTWKYSKTELAREGFDPELVPDPLFLDCPRSGAFRPLTSEVYRQIQSGEIRF